MGTPYVMAVNPPMPVRGGIMHRKWFLVLLNVPLALSGETVHLLGLVLNGLNQNGLPTVISSLVP